MTCPECGKEFDISFYQKSGLLITPYYVCKECFYNDFGETAETYILDRNEFYLSESINKMRPDR